MAGAGDDIEDDRDHPLFGRSDGTLLGRYREGWVGAKERLAREGKKATGPAPDPASLRSPDRLPPGQHETKDFPVLDLGLKPVVEPAVWSLSLAGMIERPVTLDWAAFQARATAEVTNDIHCVTDWSRLDNRWRGWAARDLLTFVRPKREARFLILHGHDGYTTNLALERFDQPDALLASHWEGKPLDRDHGGPVRAVIPSLYFWKSAKWIKHILFTDRDVPGFWESRGYHNEGDPWKQQRFG